MSITTSAKIFADVDDEINFLVEQILAAEQQKVILVLPQNALVISSLISMQMLAKQIFKSKKNLIVATEDDFGQKLVGQAGLIGVRKVSEVTAELWEQAQLKKVAAQEAAEARKRELVGSRKEEILREETSEATMTTQPSQEEDVEPEISEEVEAEQEQPGELVGAIQRRRREAQLKNVGKFEIYAGGDISEIAKNAIVSGSQAEQEPMETKEKTNTDSEVDLRKRLSRGFTNRDWTKLAGEKEQKSPLVRLPRPSLPRVFTNRWAWGLGFLLLLVFFAILGYLFMFRLTSADVRVTLEVQEVPVEQQVTANPELAEIDLENLVLPARELVDDDLSISATDAASGEGIRGEEAAGLVDIMNKTRQEEIELAAGAELTNIETDLTYVITEAVTVPAAEPDADDPDVVTPGRVTDVRIEAKEVGADYNNDDSGVQTYKLADFSTEDLIGQGYTDIQGGKSETFVAVSEEDVARVEKPLIETLQDRGRERLQNLVPAGYRLLSGSESFEKTETTSSPEIGAEAEQFSLTVEGRMTALAISEEDLTVIVEELIRSNDEVPEDFQISSVEDAAIQQVDRTETKQATFLVTSAGSLQSSITPESLGERLAGKSYADAQSVLQGIDDIAEFRLNFSPAFLPEELQFLPGDANRIQVRFAD